MELLIVLGLCFGAYELLGVFQGCFSYNDHPLPYQQALNNEQKESSDEKELDGEKESSSEVIEKSLKTETEEHEQDEEEENNESLKSGPCSCYSTVTEEELYDDTKTILKGSRRKQGTRKSSVFDKPLSKFSLSTSLMSLNRDESNLFNYIDDISSYKFSRFKSEAEISETSFNTLRNSYITDNEGRKKRSKREKNFSFEQHNENSESNSSINVDAYKKKIFFISAAS
jgi:hypothetical protein